MEYYSGIKSEILKFSDKWMVLKTINLTVLTLTRKMSPVVSDLWVSFEFLDMCVLFEITTDARKLLKGLGGVSRESR